MKPSVILSTYNQPAWLRLTLYGYLFQTDPAFEIVIADDGSGEETRELIERFKTTSDLRIQHVWHADAGFQKCTILNKAIKAAKGDYLILSDGDCVPRNDFIAVHKAHADPGFYLSGGYFKLPMQTSHAITREGIESGDCFSKKWLNANGVAKNSKLLKLTQSKLLRELCNKLTPTKRTWNGHNASCFKADALKVRGFDERMRYGGEDVEFGYRLRNSGLQAKQIRYHAVCLHLEHERAYVKPDDLAANMKIRETTLREGLKYTPHGIEQER